MMISQEEMMIILKRSLPRADYKDLEQATRSIIYNAKHWQDAELTEKIHDHLETKLMHDAFQQRAD